MMEFYEAYADYQALMTMTEELVGDRRAGRRSAPIRSTFGEHQISLAAPFARVSLREAVARGGRRSGSAAT